MLVIRDALLLQLQKDRLRQEVIMTELARIERAMALCSAAHHGIGSAYLEQPKPLSFTFNEEFMSHHRWPEHCSDADEVHDPMKKYIPHWSVQLKSWKPATEDRFSVCSRPCCSNVKAGGLNEALDEQKLQESNEVRILSFMHVLFFCPSLSFFACKFMCAFWCPAKNQFLPNLTFDHIYLACVRVVYSVFTGNFSCLVFTIHIT